MNSNDNTSIDQQTYDAREAFVLRLLADHLAELKRVAQTSPNYTDEDRARIEQQQRRVAELIATNGAMNLHTENGPGPLADNDFAAFSQPFSPGQHADESRTNGGQTADNDRTAPGQSADTPPERTSLESEIIEELNRSSQSPLDTLPAERQERLYDLIARFPITSVFRIITLPAPEGWGLVTSRQSLYRFRDRHTERKRREHRRELKVTAQAVLDDLDGADEQFTNASERLFKLRLLETANDPSSKTSDLRDLFTTLIRLRALSQKEPQQNKNRQVLGEKQG
jgi:hypothetical protein